LRQIARAVVLELRGLTVGVGDGLRQAVRVVGGGGCFPVGIGRRCKVALRVVNVGRGVTERIGDAENTTAFVVSIFCGVA